MILPPFVQVFLKDLNSELRSRYSFNSLIMFVLVTISILLFSIGQEKVTKNVIGGLFWVAVFFPAMSGLARVFVSEEEKGTVLLLQITARSTAVLWGKMLFNLALSFVINTAVVLLFFFFFPQFSFENGWLFIVAFVGGNIGISSASTLVAAIISKANSKATLYPVLSFPILLPLILIVIELTQKSMSGALFVESYAEIGTLLSYCVVMTTAAVLLFDFVWKD